jgi:hypothetical protein
MYFESQETAEKFTVTIARTMVELNNRDPNLVGRQLSADVLSLELQATETKSGEGTEAGTSGTGGGGGGPGGIPGSTRNKNTRRKSLADFQEISDAVGNALSEAEDSHQCNANFDKAVGEQVRIPQLTWSDLYPPSRLSNPSIRSLP